MIFGKKSGGVDWLVVGLGNPGMSYENTRHNAGHDGLAALCREWDVKLEKRQFKALVGTAAVNGQKILLMFPQTFMNNSGEAVGEAMRFYKLNPDRLLVMSDDISLDVGVLRVRKKGSDGGQKGLRSIIAHVGTEEFARIRIGIGAKPHPAYDLADWVLSKYRKEEQTAMDEAFEKAAKAAQMIVEGQIDEAMNKFSH